MFNIQKSLYLIFLFYLTPLSPAQNLQFTFETPRGSGDDPMIVVWLEKINAEGKRSFIKTLALYSHDHKYYKELKLWRSRNRKIETAQDVDAIVGATIKWTKTRTLTIPVQMGNHNLLDGNYMIRFESGRDKGKHYKTFKFTLPKNFKGGSFSHSGYVKKVNVKIL